MWPYSWSPYSEDSTVLGSITLEALHVKDPGPEKWAATPLLGMRRDLSGCIPETVSTSSSEMFYFQFDVFLGSWS